MDATTTKLKIDFVSDVVCPWCAIGLASLETALDRVGDEIDAELHFQPFELNPQMPPEGEDITEHLSRKYGIDAAQIARNREAIRQRGAGVGFRFGPRERTYNTFDAHRLLHWAGLEGRQHELKRALLAAYHSEGREPERRRSARRLRRSRPGSTPGVRARCSPRMPMPTRCAPRSATGLRSASTRCRR